MSLDDWEKVVTVTSPCGGAGSRRAVRGGRPAAAAAAAPVNTGPKPAAFHPCMHGLPAPPTSFPGPLAAFCAALAIFVRAIVGCSFRQACCSAPLHVGCRNVMQSAAAAPSRRLHGTLSCLTVLPEARVAPHGAPSTHSPPSALPLCVHTGRRSFHRLHQPQHGGIGNRSAARPVPDPH